MFTKSIIVIGPVHLAIPGKCANYTFWIRAGTYQLSLDFTSLYFMRGHLMSEIIQVPGPYKNNRCPINTWNVFSRYKFFYICLPKKLVKFVCPGIFVVSWQCMVSYVKTWNVSILHPLDSKITTYTHYSCPVKFKIKTSCVWVMFHFRKVEIIMMHFIHYSE